MYLCGKKAIDKGNKIEKSGYSSKGTYDTIYAQRPCMKHKVNIRLDLPKKKHVN